MSVIEDLRRSGLFASKLMQDRTMLAALDCALVNVINRRESRGVWLLVCQCCDGDNVAQIDRSVAVEMVTDNVNGADDLSSVFRPIRRERGEE